MLKEMLEGIGLPVDAVVGDEATLSIDDRLTLDLAITADHGHLVIRSLVGHIDPDADSARIREIAAANYAGASTGGGTLGVNPINGEVLLYRELPVQLLDAATLEVALSRFLDAGFLWQEVLAAPPSPTAPSQPLNAIWTQA